MRACHWLAVSVIILLPSVIFSKPLSAREITTTTFSVATGEPLLQAVLNVLNGMSTGCFGFFSVYLKIYILYKPFCGSRVSYTASDKCTEVVVWAGDQKFGNEKE